MDNDKKVSFIVASVPCLRHGVDVTQPCWSTPARTDNLPPRMGVCMQRAAMSGILLPQVRMQYARLSGPVKAA